MSERTATLVRSLEDSFAHVAHHTRTCADAPLPSKLVEPFIGIDLDTARNSALAVAVGAVVLAVLAGWLLKAIIAKIVGVLLLGVIALLVWTQRTALDDCVEQVRSRIASNSVETATCSFFGRDVTVGDG